MGERPKAGEGGWGEDGETVSSQIEAGETRREREVAREEARDLVEAQIEGLQVEKLADVPTESDLGDLYNVVPAQVETLQAGRVAESALGQAPDVVVRQVEGLELVEVAQRLRLQLHRHAARPLRVVTLKDQVVTLVVVRRSLNT